MFIWNVQGT
jgi:hypothetical protein